MNSLDQQILADADALLHRVLLGEETAVAAAREWKTRGLLGDSASRRRYNTLASLYWRARGPERASVLALYEGLISEEPKAWEMLDQALARKARGDVSSGHLLATLKSIHHERKTSVWYPGAPSTSGYPMPNVHRAGIDIPGLGSYPGNASDIPPGFLGQMQQLANQWAPPGTVFPPGFLQPPPPPSPLGDIAKLLPLTQQVLSSILALLDRAIKNAGGGSQGLDRSTFVPMGDGNILPPQAPAPRRRMVPSLAVPRSQQQVQAVARTNQAMQAAMQMKPR